MQMKLILTTNGQSRQINYFKKDDFYVLYVRVISLDVGGLCMTSDYSCGGDGDGRW